MFSVIIPTFNRAATCAVAVKSVLAQRANMAYEVIVVDNNSADDTRERIQRLCAQAPDKLRYLCEVMPGASAARNAGVAAARGDIVAFMDDDAVADPEWLNALAETYHTHPDAWCVGGKIVLALPEPLPRWFERASSVLMSHLGHLDLGDGVLALPYPHDVFGGNFSVRRDVLDRVGLFDAAFGPADRSRIEAEESELCWRIQAAGGAVYYCGYAIVTHLIPTDRVTKRYMRGRAVWSGRTWVLLDRPDIVMVRPRDLVWAALRVVRNWIRLRISPGRADRRKVVDQELRFWQCVGYMQQRALARLGFGWRRPR